MRAAGKKSADSADRDEAELSALEKMQAAIEAGKGARTASLTKDEASVVKGLGLMTLKPLIYAANVMEEDLANQGASNTHVQARRRLGQGRRLWAGPGDVGGCGRRGCTPAAAHTPSEAPCVGVRSASLSALAARAELSSL